MIRRVGTLTLLALSAIGCAARAVRVESESPGTLEPVMMPVNARALPTGTDLYVELDNRIGRGTRVGDLFSATVRHTVYAQNGARAVPAGAKVYGRVAALDRPSFPVEPMAIRLDFNRLVFGGRGYPFDAQIASTDLDERVPARSFNERVLLATTAIGALIGAAVTGGEIEGVLGGAAIGAVGGVVYSYARGGSSDAALPAGSHMTLRTTRPIALRSTTRAATTRRRSYRYTP
jgi:hypothetical protein